MEHNSPYPAPKTGSKRRKVAHGKGGSLTSEKNWGRRNSTTIWQVYSTNVAMMPPNALPW